MAIPDRHVLALPPDLAPGEYEVRAGLYDPQSGARLALQSIGGEPNKGDSVSLGVVTVASGGS
jgi:hypothetical protein